MFSNLDSELDSSYRNFDEKTRREIDRLLVLRIRLFRAWALAVVLLIAGLVMRIAVFH